MFHFFIRKNLEKNKISVWMELWSYLQKDKNILRENQIRTLWKNDSFGVVYAHGDSKYSGKIFSLQPSSEIVTLIPVHDFGMP